MEYAFKEITSGKIVKYDLKISEYDEFKKSNPNLERYHESAPAFLYDGVLTSGFDAKTDNTWKEVLAKVADKHPGSELANNYKKKSVKEVKTREILNKHLNKRKKQK
jgi:hypothetical protein